MCNPIQFKIIYVHHYVSDSIRIGSILVIYLSYPPSKFTNPPHLYGF